MTKRRTGPKGAGTSARKGPQVGAEPVRVSDAVELPGEREAAGDGDPENESASESEREVAEGPDGDAEELPIALLIAESFGEPKRSGRVETADGDAEPEVGADVNARTVVAEVAAESEAGPHAGEHDVADDAAVEPEAGSDAGEEDVADDAAVEPKAGSDPNPDDAGPEPGSGPDTAAGSDVSAASAEPETEPGPDRYVDDSGLMEALKQLKVRRDRNRDLTIGIGCGIVGLVIGLIIGNTTAGSGSGGPATVSPAVAASRGDLPDVTAGPTQDLSTTIAPTSPDSSPAGVVTFTVTGSAPGGVLITYGTNSTGSQSTKLPFTGSMPLDSSGGVLYYDVYAQLHGSGSLTCSVAVNGKVIKTGTATTTSDICSAQIAQDPATGQWQSE